MVEIITQYKKDWTMFTLASLLDKQDEDWRLHVYVDEANWKDREVRWMLDNFKQVRIYESFWNTEDTAKQMCHLKNWWSDKTPGLGKRLVFANGNKKSLEYDEKLHFMSSLGDKHFHYEPM